MTRSATQYSLSMPCPPGYCGTDDHYLNDVARFLKPGGQTGIASAGVMREIDAAKPHHPEGDESHAVSIAQQLPVLAITLQCERTVRTRTAKGQRTAGRG